MNKYTTSDAAIAELEKTQGLLPFDTDEDRKEYEKLIVKTDTKTNLILKMQKAGYSEFTMGMVIGNQITEENSEVMKRSWIPRIFRK